MRVPGRVRLPAPRAVKLHDLDPPLGEETCSVHGFAGTELQALFAPEADAGRGHATASKSQAPPLPHTPGEGCTSKLEGALDSGSCHRSARPSSHPALFLDPSTQGQCKKIPPYSP